MSVSVSNNVSVRGWRRRTTEEETEEADAEQKTRTPHRDEMWGTKRDNQWTLKNRNKNQSR